MRIVGMERKMIIHVHVDKRWKKNEGKVEKRADTGRVYVTRL